MYTPTINSNVVYEFHSFVFLLTLIFFFSFQMNTFQVVIITDGVYSFVMYNYPEGGIQWSAPTSVLVKIHLLLNLDLNMRLIFSCLT